MNIPPSRKTLSLEHISFSYDQQTNVLKDVNFDIYENEYVCIIGHNGSGKSTISKILVGLLKPSVGVVKIYDETITYLNLHYLRKNVGIIFQNPDSQFIGFTPKDDIVFGLENRKINPAYMDKIVNHISKVVDIENILDQNAISLSGGEKQRVAIASVLAINPKIIIFDESTSMLDPKGKMYIKQIMLDLKFNLKKTVISITHDMDEVLNADRVIVMKQGEVIKNGKPAEIFVDEKFLKTSSLDFPFILKLANELKQKGFKIDLTLDPKHLIDQLCQLKK